MRKRIDEARIISRYTNGDAVRVIAVEESVTVQTIYDVLDRNGARRRNGAVDEARFLKIAEAQGVAHAADSLGISTRTGERILRAVRGRGETVTIRRGRPPTGTPEEQAFRRLWKSPFPYPPLLNEEETRIEFDRLRHVESFLDGDVIRPRSNAGLRLCYPFFPNRYDARSGKNVSAREAWESERNLRRAVRLQIAYGDPTTPERVLRAVTLGCRTPTIFRPAVAKFICERYAGQGATVWDPCSGYGGRLLGAASTCVRYIGTDVDEATVEGNQRLAETVGADAQVTRCPAEDFTPPDDVSLVFTSPPYFDRERYSESIDQSWRRHKTPEQWITGFLRPVITRAWNCLRVGGYLVLNVADIRTRNAVIPIESETVRAAILTGFYHVESLQMPIAGINRKSPSEPVLVFQK